MGGKAVIVVIVAPAVVLCQNAAGTVGDAIANGKS